MAGSVTSKRKNSQQIPMRKVVIDFLYLDLSLCGPCQGTQAALEESIALLTPVFEATGVEIVLNKIHITSEEQAVELGFLVSPTVRVNGQDIQMNFRESQCDSCGTLCGCEEDILCREWEDQGQWHTAPPKGLLIEGILKEVYGGVVQRQPASQKMKEAPENLRRFFSGMKQKEAAERS